VLHCADCAAGLEVFLRYVTTVAFRLYLLTYLLLRVMLQEGSRPDQENINGFRMTTSAVSVLRRMSSGGM